MLQGCRRTGLAAMFQSLNPPETSSKTRALLGKIHITKVLLFSSGLYTSTPDP